MKTGTLILRSLRFYWRTNLGVLAGVAVAGAILTGALAVGDSVRASLRRAALLRLGTTQSSLVSQDRFFRAALAGEIESELRATVVPVLLLRGAVTTPDGSARANAAQIVGVEERFWKLGGTNNCLAGAAPGDAVINERLAEQLGARIGTTIVVRVEQPPMISRDAPLSGESSLAVEIHLRIRAIVGADDFGRFGLRAEQTPPASVFVPIAALQTELKRDGLSNVLLTEGNCSANGILRRRWQIADAGLEVRTLGEGKTVELRTPQIFLPPVVANAALALSSNATGVLTYFVNDVIRGSNYTPYSFVTAVGSAQRDDEITINSWMAEDLDAKLGDELTLKYVVIGERRELREESAKFRVSKIIPVAKDESWMPAFPGLADKESCGDWTPGVPIDHDHMRSQDGDYWTEYHGTPKAFVSLAAGQKMWGNRFGKLTAIRFPAGEYSSADLERLLLARLNPAEIGLAFVPVRSAALAASGQSLDFGQLFIGFSFFLIVAALLLTAMLFAFNLEQRNTEIGLLRALGWRGGQIRRLLWFEGFALAALGTLAGLAMGIGYTRLTLLGLATIWRGAAGAMPMVYHAEPLTLVIGASLSLLAAGGSMAIVQRGQARRAPATLLAGGADAEMPGGRSRSGLWIGMAALLGAVVLLAMAGRAQGEEAAGIFFGAGACLLIAGIGFSQTLLAALTRTTHTARTLAALGLRNAARRRRRSLTVVGVLASGVFLLVAVSAFHADARAGAQSRHSGTGGFALFAQATLPIYDDLNTTNGRSVFGLNDGDFTDVSVVPLRVREGDDASCLNLNRAQQPRMLGARAEEFEKRNAFTFISDGGNWTALDQPQPDGAIPAIGDEPTVTWALGRKVGDTLTFADDQGKTCTVRIVAMLASSVFQGGLLISERKFIAHFPSSSGYRAFLVDAPIARTVDVSAVLTRALQDHGVEVVPAWRRLAEFMEVENTYLGIFQALGGLGLILGSVGFGIVVLRNVMERRRELALLQAVGFSRAALHRFVLGEHWLLIVLGLAVGILSAVLAVAPALFARGSDIPVLSLGLTLVCLALGGFAWSWLGARLALRGKLLESLRNE